MIKEIEYSLIDIDKKEIRDKLSALSATKIYDEYLQKRAVFMIEHNSEIRRFIRVRQEYDKVTVTYKNKTNNNFAEELEIIVNDFDKAVEIFKLASKEQDQYIENYREKYIYNDLEIVIDTYPWLSSLIEIEGNSEEEIFSFIKLLELNENDFKKVAAGYYYKNKYGKNIQDLSREDRMNIRFGEENPFLK